jgi:hypothetical protein
MLLYYKRGSSYLPKILHLSAVIFKDMIRNVQTKLMSWLAHSVIQILNPEVCYPEVAFMGFLVLALNYLVANL